MTRAENKAQRLLQIEALLLEHPEGLSQADIARRMGVNRSTIHRNLPDLTQHAPIFEEDGRLFIDRKAYLVNLRLNLYEATSLHLATRLLTTRIERQNPHTASLLRKLSLTIESLSPQISRHLALSADAADDLARFQDPHYLSVLETLTLAWAEGRMVEIWHRHTALNQIHKYRFGVYFIEPYAIGQAIHAVGYREPPGAIRTFNLARIERIEITNDFYQKPEGFNPSALLEQAWGIWYSENDPQIVKLRFSPVVAERVMETRWHPTQRTTPDTNGSLLWKAEIAEPKEMIPWVRGWGADCEVIEPEWLRDKLIYETLLLAKIYRIDSKPENSLIAHWRSWDKQAQMLLTHLTETSNLTERFAEKIGLPEVGKILGLLHDFGKASDEYQNYLRSAEGLLKPEQEEYVDYIAKRGKIDHSTAGAQLVFEKLFDRGHEGKLVAQVLALTVASHHSGLIDCLTPDGNNNFQRRIEKSNEETHLNEARKKLTVIEQQLNKTLAKPVEQTFFKKLSEEMKEQSSSKATLAFKHGLLTRFLLSCLLDADRLNTADFEMPQNRILRNYGKYHPWELLIQRLEQKYEVFVRTTSEMPQGRAYEVNQIRNQVAQACLDIANQAKGIYQLTVPTGGGKTLASLRFALHHAAKYQMDRIFYVVPYITIIDQNADEVRKILEDQDENGNLFGNVVLEHHSNLTPEEETHRHKLLAENWDSQIVFTTQVQFLETLFGAGTRNARRMHQLANAVIILDEVQTIPIKITDMFTTALRFLTHDCGSTGVLCTATQPPFENTGSPYRALNIKPEHKIIQNEQELFNKLKRVKVHDERRPGGWSNMEVADLAKHALEDKGSVLIVLNTKKSARSLYQEIKSWDICTTYHLSTNMCPAHRSNILDIIKGKLADNQPVICASTQLIEAGVDIDFGAVIRSLAGLDSITQAAGRCNRHGKRDKGGSVWVVNPLEENLSHLPDIKTGRDKAQTVLDNYRDDPNQFENDPIGLNALDEYYKFYYPVRHTDMRYPVKASSSVGREDDLFNLLSLNTVSTQVYLRINQVKPDIFLRQSFQSAGKAFQVIESVSQGIIVPYEEGETVITDLCATSNVEKQYQLLKRAQYFSVNLFTNEFNKLFKIGAIKEVQSGSGIYYLDKQFYSMAFGWSDEPVDDMELLMQY